MKPLFKVFCICSMFLVLSHIGMAQDSIPVVDSTGTGGSTNPGTGTSILDIIIEKLGLIIHVVLGVYELIVRLVPTIKDQSLVNNVVKVLQWILDKLVPNKAKDGGTH